MYIYICIYIYIHTCSCASLRRRIGSSAVIASERKAPNCTNACSVRTASATSDVAAPGCESARATELARSSRSDSGAWWRASGRYAATAPT